MKGGKHLMRQFTIVMSWLLGLSMAVAAEVPEVTWDKYSLIIDGQRVCPVMGGALFAHTSGRMG